MTATVAIQKRAFVCVGDKKSCVNLSIVQNSRHISFFQTVVPSSYLHLIINKLERKITPKLMASL
jgi:hypothetical protein